jgi:Fe-S cluster biosynthesis and repair protein YggX
MKSAKISNKSYFIHLICLLFTISLVKSDFDEDVLKVFPNITPKENYAYIPAIKRFTEAMLETTDQTLKEYALNDDREPFIKRFKLDDNEKAKPVHLNEVTVELIVFDEEKSFEDLNSNSAVSLNTKSVSSSPDELIVERKLEEISGDMSQQMETESDQSLTFDENKVDLMDPNQRRTLEKVKAMKKLKIMDELGIYFPLLHFSVGLGDYDEESKDIWNQRDEEERRLSSKKSKIVKKNETRKLVKIDINTIIESIEQQRHSNKKRTKIRIENLGEVMNSDYNESPETSSPQIQITHEIKIEHSGGTSHHTEGIKSL